MADATATTKVFDLGFPFAYRGAEYKSFTARRPKVRDLRVFIKTVDADSIKAMEVLLANLFEVQPEIVAEIDVQDFAPMKDWFEDFLKPMLGVSNE